MFLPLDLKWQQGGGFKPWERVAIGRRVPDQGSQYRDSGCRLGEIMISALLPSSPPSSRLCFPLGNRPTRSQKAREPIDEERLLIAQSKMEGGEWIWMINRKYRTDALGKQTK